MLNEAKRLLFLRKFSYTNIKIMNLKKLLLNSIMTINVSLKNK